MRRPDPVPNRISENDSYPSMSCRIGSTCGRPPRPEQRRAHPHVGGPLLDRHLEVVAHAHREPAGEALPTRGGRRARRAARGGGGTRGGSLRDRRPGAGWPSGRRSAGAGGRRAGGPPRRAPPARSRACSPRRRGYLQEAGDGEPAGGGLAVERPRRCSGGRSSGWCGTGRGRGGPCWTAGGRSGATRSRAAARGSWRAPPGPGSRRRPSEPACQAAASAAAGWVLLAPTRTTLPAGRPARRQASAMRSLIRARRSGHLPELPLTAQAGSSSK